MEIKSVPNCIKFKESEALNKNIVFYRKGRKKTWKNKILFSGRK